MFKLFTKSKLIFVLLPCIFFVTRLHAQQLKITDFVLFGGQDNLSGKCTNPPFPGYSVNLASSVNITSGRIGSYKLITSTGNGNLSSSLNSGGTINLANGTKVSGNITAQNQYHATGNILKMGSNAYIGANIDVNGNIYISSGTVAGDVTHPPGTTYFGPKPGGKEYKKTPNLPTLPQMPAITNFTCGGTTDITGTKIISPGSYRNMKLTGNQTVTFSGPGDYYFKSIHNKNSNDLQNTSSKKQGNSKPTGKNLSNEYNQSLTEYRLAYYKILYNFGFSNQLCPLPTAPHSSPGQPPELI